MAHEFQPPETCTLLLSLKDAANFAERLSGLGFEKHEEVFQYLGPKGAYSADMLDAGDGKIVIIERRGNTARVEMARKDFVEMSALLSIDARD